MSTISKYVLVDADDNEEDYEYDRYDDAEREALTRDEPMAIIEREYEYSDSSLVWTSTGANEWPPNDSHYSMGEQESA